MISLCLPTRGRPKEFKRLCESVIETADNPNEIEFVSYHDDDDKSAYKFIGNHKEIYGKRIKLSAMWNKCQKIATGEIYLFVMDDAVFYTKGWDTAVYNAFAQTPDKILFVYFNDQRLRSSHGSVFCLHKNWVDAVGYFVSPEFDAGKIDNWINDVAAMIDRKYFLRGYIVKHLNVIDDKTHNDYVVRNVYTNRLYKSTLEKRIRDAKLLKNYIRKYTSKKAGGISIFAKRAYLNTMPGEEYEFSGDKPVRGYLKRVSSIIRADQVSQAIGAKLNPTKDFENDVCIYVKPALNANNEFKFVGKSVYLDIVDEIGYVSFLKKYPKVSAIVLSERDYINLSTEGLKNKIYLIPQHHCNFERVERTRKKITTAGVIGHAKAFDYLPPDLNTQLKKRGIELLTFSNFFRREDIVDFYKKIDIQIVWRPYKKKLANPIKIVNAASFGIPTLALEESHFKDLGNCYIGVQRLDQLLNELDLLIKYPARYEAFSKLCLKRAEEYHMENIAKLYKALP